MVRKNVQKTFKSSQIHGFGFGSVCQARNTRILYQRGRIARACKTILCTCLLSILMLCSSRTRTPHHAKHLAIYGGELVTQLPLYAPGPDRRALHSESSIPSFSRPVPIHCQIGTRALMSYEMVVGHSSYDTYGTHTESSFEKTTNE